MNNSSNKEHFYDFIPALILTEENKKIPHLVPLQVVHRVTVSSS
jgi:hypothetical protein